MSVRSLAPALGVAATLMLAACAGTGSIQTGAAPAFGAGSNFGPAMGAAYAAAPTTCAPAQAAVDGIVCHNGNSARVAGLASNNSPALGAIFDPTQSGCEIPGAESCQYANTVDVILPEPTVHATAVTKPHRRMAAADAAKSNNGPALGASFDVQNGACDVPGSTNCPYSNDVATILPAGQLTADADAVKSKPSGGGKTASGKLSPAVVIHDSPPLDSSNHMELGGGIDTSIETPPGPQSGLDYGLGNRPTTMVAGCAANGGQNSPPSASIVIIAGGGGYLYCGEQLIGEITPDYFSSPVEMMAIGFKPTRVQNLAELPPIHRSADSTHSAVNAQSDRLPDCGDPPCHLGGGIDVTAVTVASQARQFEKIANGSQMTIFLETG